MFDSAAPWMVSHSVMFDSVAPWMVSHSVMFDSVAPWTVARQAPLSMGFSRQQYYSVLAFSPPGDLPGPGIEPKSVALQADSLSSELSGKP